MAAIAALADGLHHDPTMQGLWHFALLFVPVWWAWMEFTWFATAGQRRPIPPVDAARGAGHRDGRRHRLLLKGKGDSLFVWSYAGLQMLLIVMFAGRMRDRRAGWCATT